MAKKHMKKYSPSLDIKELEIKTTLRFYLTPVRVAIIKNTTNNMCWQGRGQKGILVHCLCTSWYNYSEINLKAF
jgi:hypothetical protein